MCSLVLLQNHAISLPHVHATWHPPFNRALSRIIPQRSPVTHEERVILFLKTDESKAIEQSLVTTIKERHCNQILFNITFIQS